MPPSALVQYVDNPALANAYCSLAFATQFDLDRPAGTAAVPVPTWSSATSVQQTAAILWATKLMDRLWHWTGYPTDAVQALLWPRGGILNVNGWVYIDLHTVPPEIQQATAEYARQLLVSDRTADSEIETQGVLGLKAGSVSLTFKPSVFAKQVPDSVYALVPQMWGYPRSRTSGMRHLMRA
jgi:hypothetical protein